MSENVKKRKKYF